MNGHGNYKSHLSVFGIEIVSLAVGAMSFLDILITVGGEKKAGKSGR